MTSTRRESVPSSSLRPLARPPSVFSTVSGIADSTISFTGLSLFPNPPDSIPSTPTPSEYAPSSPARSTRSNLSNIPNRSHVHPPPLPSYRNDRNGSNVAGPSYTRPGASRPPSSDAPGTFPLDSPTGGEGPASPSARNLSPYDWHEGASSIDVDAAEDRLLSTSFITSLLQESDASSGQRSRHASIASEALSGTSEMTYPPTPQYSNDRPLLTPSIPSFPSRNHTTSVRGARPPPSSFAAIPEYSGHISDDSDTVYSHNDQYVQVQPTLIRSANRTMAPSPGIRGASVLGVAPATLRTLSASSTSDPAMRRSAFHGANGGSRRSTSFEDFEGKMALDGLHDHHPSVPYSPALPSTAGTRAHFLRDSSRTSTHPARQSIHSTKSYVPSLISKISSTGRSITRALSWKKKPLPPVPTIAHIPVAVETEHRARESSVPLPDLVARADALNGMLEKGYHPHRSLTSYARSSVKDDVLTSGYDPDFGDDEGSRYRRYPDDRRATQLFNAPDSPKVHDARKKRRFWIIIVAFVIIALGAVGAGVGVSINRKGVSLPVCSGSLTGAACNLNGTCVCTPSIDGRCNGLAQTLVDLTPTMNQLFSSNYSLSDVFNAIWLAQGSFSTCTSQSLLVDVAPALDSGMFPNRTAWAQSALLWNLVRSQDSGDVSEMQDFIKRAPWSGIGNSDGPIEDSSNSFTITMSGFIFNFAAQTTTHLFVTFEDNGQPTSGQIARVGDTAKTVLDNAYSVALASSTQRQSALYSYWTSILLQQPQDLVNFISALTSSPILIPFDAAAQAVRQLWDSTSDPFPPPNACYPDLNSSLIEKLNELEGSVFGLSPIKVSSTFDFSCYADRPVYGMLNVLRLRLPFVDSRTGVAKQAAHLIRDVNPRTVIYSGEVLSALPAHSNSTGRSFDSREFGTFNHINHVILNYFNAMPSVNVARAVVDYILSSSVAPPDRDSLIGQSLSSIPSLEVAVFGSILPSDISNIRSSFTNPSGSLFFGSSAGDSLRDWAITETQHSILWTESSTSPMFARDSKFDDTFEAIWSAAAEAIEKNVANVGVGNITQSLNSTGKLSSS